MNDKKIIKVQILNYEMDNKRFIAKDYYNNKYSVPCGLYSIYNFSPENEINKIVEGYIDNIDRKKDYTKIDRKSYMKDLIDTTKIGEIVEAKVTEIKSSNLLLCTIKEDIRAYIYISNLLSKPASVNSIGEIFKIGNLFDARIINKNSFNAFSLSTNYDFYKIPDDELKKIKILYGTIGTPVFIKGNIPTNTYVYYYHITFRTIGYIYSNVPLNYTEKVYAQYIKTIKTKKCEKIIFKYISI